MTHAPTVPDFAPDATRRSGFGSRLFKADHPRAIDRYIDYFGGGGQRADGRQGPDAAHAGRSEEGRRC